MLIFLEMGLVCGMINLCSFHLQAFLTINTIIFNHILKYTVPYSLPQDRDLLMHAITLDENYSFKGSEG